MMMMVMVMVMVIDLIVMVDENDIDLCSWTGTTEEFGRLTGLENSVVKVLYIVLYCIYKVDNDAAG